MGTQKKYIQGCRSKTGAHTLLLWLMLRLSICILNSSKIFVFLGKRIDYY